MTVNWVASSRADGEPLSSYGKRQTRQLEPVPARTRDRVVVAGIRVANADVPP